MRDASKLMIAAGLALVMAVGCGKKADEPAGDDAAAQATVAPTTDEAAADAGEATGDDDAMAATDDDPLPPVPSLALNRPGMLGDDDKAEDGGVDLAGEDDGAAIDAAMALPPEQRASKADCEKAADQLNAMMLEQTTAMLPADADDAMKAQLMEMTKQKLAGQRAQFIGSCETSMPKDVVACFTGAKNMQAWIACASEAAPEGSSDNPLTEEDKAFFERAFDHQSKILDVIETNKDDVEAAADALVKYVETHGEELRTLEAKGEALQEKLKANPQQAMQLLSTLQPKMEAMSKRLRELTPVLEQLAKNEKAKAALQKLQLGN